MSKTVNIGIPISKTVPETYFAEDLLTGRNMSLCTLINVCCADVY